MAKTDEVLAGIRFFSGLSGRELSSIARLMTAVDVPAGKVLAREGSVGREFFVIVDGEAEVTRGGRLLKVLGPGDHFGEVALLDATTRTATVTARTPMTVEVLTRSEFGDLLDDAPTVTRKLLRGMAAMLEDAAGF
jgi:CRP/FNR family cyclic AMP-dependent transcriptional regulator